MQPGITIKLQPESTTIARLRDIAEKAEKACELTGVDPATAEIYFILAMNGTIKQIQVKEPKK